MKILAPTDEAIHLAAAALQAGDLVGFPTETVYGIAADATNRNAVLKTFALKRRPAENPLIVHVGSLEQAADLVAEIPPAAKILARNFWPGPLTMVLRKTDRIPSEATGGLDTVAIRVPAHPVALAILQAAGTPLTAPSANEFMGLSPTRAEHISPKILEGLACVIDGGPCGVGVESTVVDCTGNEVTILRPGGISRAIIEIMLKTDIKLGAGDDHRSPGSYRRHYSPKTRVRLVDSLGPFDAGIGFNPPQNIRQIQLPADPDDYARELYASLYKLDSMGRLELLIEMPPDTMEWEAVWDRIEKASGSES